MNKNTIYLAIFTVLCILAGALAGITVARQVCPRGPDMGRPRFAEKAERFMRRGPDRGEPGEWLFRMFAERLELDKDQQAKVQNILEKMRQDIDEVGKSVRNALDEIKNVSDKQIMDILTPAQQEKFKVILEEMKDKFDRHGPMRGRGPMDEEGPYPPQG
jgi:hypothetical protein